jgi:large conductance mechanosensitive channel
MFKEFKDFAMKGNLIDIAVGMVMGGAFGKLASAFVDGMVLPLISKIFTLPPFDKLNTVLTAEVKDAAGKVTTPEVAVKTGDFISTIINFIIVAAVMFMIVKAINKTKKAEAAAPPPPPPAQETLLSEIRDLLKSGR